MSTQMIVARSTHLWLVSSWNRRTLSCCFRTLKIPICLLLVVKSFTYITDTNVTNSAGTTLYITDTGYIHNNTWIKHERLDTNEVIKTQLDKDIKDMQLSWQALIRSVHSSTVNWWTQL